MEDFLIVADQSGKELRALVYTSYDFEVGDVENSFEIRIKRQEYESIPDQARIYIPDTEYGGLFRKLQTDTKEDIISPGGLTWRGMMQKKIIEPPAGADYATDSGELNAIIKSRVEAALPGLFIGTEASTGVTVNWQYDRYCTLESGLTKMLKSKGYKLSIAYSQSDKAVIVSAVPIVNYSQDIEFSSDLRINYFMSMQDDGVNHLICLGKGELKDRTVFDLYIDEVGNVATTPYYTGIDEVAEVYDYAGAELSDLIESGSYRLQEITNKNVFEITVDPDMEIAIGDIVGGRDYISGMSMQSQISGKIVRWDNGFKTIEYQLANIAQKPKPIDVGNDYIVGPYIGKKRIALELLGTLSMVQAFTKYNGKYYSTNGSGITVQKSDFTVEGEYTLSLGHGNSLQIGSSNLAYVSGWDDNKIYVVNLSTMQVQTPITLPTTGYTTGVVDDVNKLAYIFQRDTRPNTEEYYNFIVYDYENDRTVTEKKTTMKMGAMQACDFLDGMIIVLNGLGTDALPNGYRVFDINCTLLYEYIIDSKATIEPEGVYIDRATKDVLISYVGKKVYRIKT